MAWPATKTIIAMKDTSQPDITIKATGYQWKWGYDYLQEGISFYSTLSTPREQIEATTRRAAKASTTCVEVDNPVVVPIGKKVRIITTANDVIHAWWVPALGIKQDAIPGFVRDTWFKADNPGIYRGQCAELCGKDHGFMPIVVEAVTPEQYAQWVGEQKKKAAAQADDPAKAWTLAELVGARREGLRGELPGLPPAERHGRAAGRSRRSSGSKIVNGPKEAHIDIVLNGKPGTAMAPFKHLSDVEIAAVVTYERNAWTNKTGDMVSPAEVKASRK